MTDPLTPTAGARFVLELAADGEVAGGGARYRGRVVTPEATFEYDVALAPGAEPVVAVRGEAAPAELAGTLVMLAKLCARGADKRVADGLPAWPGRITRWRGPGRGG